MPDQKNLILAIALSIAIVLGFEFFYNQPRLERERALQAERAARDTPAQVQQPGAPPAPGTAPATGTPAVPGTAMPAGAAVRSRAEVIAGRPRVTIATPRLQGSIALRGGRLDDLLLTAYRETVDPNSPPITLLSPVGTANPYFAQYGWAAVGNVAVPTDTTEWTADRTTLTPAQPVTLSWDNGQGLRFERRIAIDEHYMFTITDRVTNSGGAPVQLASYGLVQRIGTPRTEGFFILHEGPIGVFNNTLHEYSYSDLSTAVQQRSAGGWLGFTDKYWLVALVPNQSGEKTARLQHTNSGGDRYQTDVTAAAETVAPGATLEVTNRLFAGAKEVHTLDRYAEQLQIPLFDRAIDFGWFYFLTRPIFLILDFFGRTLGNFGLGILLLTVIIKAIFFPLANKSYRAMAKMKALQPEMEKLREKYGDDRQKMSQAMMELYKKSGANPLAGCLPIVVQIPVFFALYKVLFITIEMRHAPFFGWIRDLSAPDPTTIFNLFGLLPFTPPAFLPLLGIWPLIMGATMFLQQKLNPQPADPVQARIFLFMPLIFTFLLANFAAGLVIYWAWNNLLSIAQQWVIMKRTPVPK
jgi:YidC/Oxa1 family membrane protein insertase